MTKYIIDEHQLKCLLKRSLTLTALESYGVDNWITIVNQYMNLKIMMKKKAK